MGDTLFDQADYGRVGPSARPRCRLCGAVVVEGDALATWAGEPAHLDPCVSAAREALALLAEQAPSARRRAAAAVALDVA